MRDWGTDTTCSAYKEAVSLSPRRRKVVSSEQLLFRFPWRATARALAIWDHRSADAQILIAFPGHHPHT